MSGRQNRARRLRRVARDVRGSIHHQKKKMVARAGLVSEQGSAGAGAGSYSGFLLERWV